MDTRTVWFAVETKDEQDRLSLKYPGRILLCNRTFVLDTHSGKAVEGTQRMHEGLDRWTQTFQLCTHENRQEQLQTYLAIASNATLIQQT